jgi:hypothetical protein
MLYKRGRTYNHIKTKGNPFLKSNPIFKNPYEGKRKGKEENSKRVQLFLFSD